MLGPMETKTCRVGILFPILMILHVRRTDLNTSWESDDDYSVKSSSAKYREWRTGEKDGAILVHLRQGAAQAVQCEAHGLARVKHIDDARVGA